MDLRILKFFTIKPQGGLDLVVEAFKVLNRVNVTQLNYIYGGARRLLRRSGVRRMPHRHGECNSQSTLNFSERHRNESTIIREVNMRMKIVSVIGLFCCWSTFLVHAQDAHMNVADAESATVLEQVIQKPAGPPPTPAHTGIKAMLKGLAIDFTHLPSRENLFWTGVGGGLALAVHPADDSVNAHLVGKEWVHNVFRPGAIMGASQTLLGVSATIYAIGRLNNEPKVSHVGMDLLRSLAVSEGVTQTLKYTVRRERPDGSGRNSFPSGHAADTFAFATALERHLGWRGAVPAYLLSSYVAASRLHENRHFTSDVVFGAAVGIIAGRTVTRHGREYYAAEVEFVPGGAALVFTRLGR